jgi:spore coat polysaccharide biosynthesis protein SpsF (cytidylyltransferase family)
VLLPLGERNECVTEFMHRRLGKILSIPIIVAIPDTNDNDILYERLTSRGITVFRGPERDVMLRYLMCAKYYNFEIIIRLTSDCPLIDPNLISEMIKEFASKSTDYISNTTPLSESTFPDGSDIEIFKIDALEKAANSCSERRLREHVTFQFWEPNTDFSSQTYKNNTDESDLRFTLDHPEDYEVIRRIVKHFETIDADFDTKAIISFLRENPSISKINQNFKAGDNW